MPVDFQQYVAAVLCGLIDQVAGGAVKVAVHFGPFEQGFIRAKGFELVFSDKTVFAPVYLAAAGLACGAGNRQNQRAILVEQGLDQAGFAGAAGRNHHKHIAGAFGHKSG